MNQDTQAVSHAVMAFLDAYAKGDIDGCMGFVAQNSPILILRTNLDEVCKSRDDVLDALRHDIATLSNVKWGKIRHIQIIQDKSLASVLLELPLAYVAGGKEEQVAFRYALCMTMESGQWKITSGVASVLAAEDNYSFP